MSSQHKELQLSIDNSAFEETLQLLEWSKLCEQLSLFASTSQGRRRCIACSIPNKLTLSRRCLAETLEIGAIDLEEEDGVSLTGVHDIEPIILRCSKGGVASAPELLKVVETLRTTRRLRRQIEDSVARPVISELFSNVATLPELQKLLQFGIEDGGRIADRASEKLASLRRQVQVMRIERKDLLRDLIRRFHSVLQDTVISERYERPVLALKISAADHVVGTIHDTSSSGNTVFIEPKVVIPLGNEIAKLEAKIYLEEQRLLAYWSSQISDNFLSLNHLYQILLELDFALARARYSHWLGGVAPELKEELDAPFFIQDFRHPLLIWQEHYHEGSAVVPITFRVSSTLKVLAITGPNTGGKTVALKSLGLAILMSKLGLLLPCTGEPSLPWCNQVLADIGDEQSLEQNLSTFSGHIVRITKILDSISTNPGPSIVLLDELGAGTDPTEGTSLATALLMLLADRARLTVATTHFGELKALKYSDSRFENASVGFNSETLEPTYHLQWGIPGRSNALAIARRLGLDETVIDNAQQLMQRNGIDSVNDVIEGLEEQRRRQQEAAEDAASLLARTELLHEELISQWERQCRQSKDFEERGRKKLEGSIRRGQVEVRDLIRRLRDGSADGEMARKTGQRLRQMELTYSQEKIKNHHQSWLPKKGDRVRVSAIGKSGEVIEVSEDGSQLTVLCGVFRSTVDLNAVESLDGQKPIHPAKDSVVTVKSRVSLTNQSKIRTKKNTIDVRGLRVHEAEAAVEEKLRNSLGPLWIVHGIGTGRLKRGLLEWLQNLDYVEKITRAEQKDGGAGCTVIWLK